MSKAITCPFCGAKPYLNKFNNECIKHYGNCYFGLIYADLDVTIQNIEVWNNRSLQSIEPEN